MGKIDREVDRIHDQVGGQGKCLPQGLQVSDSGIGAYRHRGAPLVGGRASQRIHQGPDLGQTRRRVSVGKTETIVLAEVQPATIPVAGTIPLPGKNLVERGTAVAAAGTLRRQGQDRLHIAPTQPRCGIQHQRGDTRHHRCRRRGAAETVGVIAGCVDAAVVALTGSHTVGRHRSLWRRKQDMCAVGRIAGDLARGRCGRDTHRSPRGVQRITVSIESVVASGLDIDRTQTTTTGSKRRLEAVDIGVADKAGGAAVTMVSDIEGAELV